MENASAAAHPEMELLRFGLSRKNIPALDGLRAIAVFLVICYHFGFDWVPGSHGVLFFFVLSGFLITWILLKEDEVNGSVSLGNFYTRRALRICPAFYCYWAFGLALLWLRHREIPWPHAWSAFFYVSNYYNALQDHPSSFVSHTWSLGIEEQFYLLWPILFVLWRTDLDRLRRILIGIIGAIWLYRAILKLGAGVDQSYIYNAFDTRLDSLLVGCLLAVMLRGGTGTAVWSRLVSRSYLPAVTAALLVTSMLLEKRFGSPYRDVVGFALDPVLFAILMVQLIPLSARTAWRWINWSWLRYLGRISYSLYLYQQVTLYTTRRALASHPQMVQLAAAIGITVLAATASYFVVEKPFLRLRNRLPSPVPA